MFKYTGMLDFLMILCTAVIKWQIIFQACTDHMAFKIIPPISLEDRAEIVLCLKCEYEYLNGGLAHPLFQIKPITSSALFGFIFKF